MAPPSIFLVVQPHFHACQNLHNFEALEMANPEEKTSRYKYFDTPDGEDTLKKLWCVLKPTIPSAVGIGICDVMLYSHPKGVGPIALRLSAVSLPIIGISSTFVMATNSLASIRQKDDHWNWVLGGFIAGSMCGLWARNRMLGFNMGMLGGILGALRKEAAINGWEITPTNVKIRTGGATSTDRDYSWTAERPRNWTTE